MVLLHSIELVVFDGRREVARHERLAAGSECRLELDHYLAGDADPQRAPRPPAVTSLPRRRLASLPVSEPAAQVSDLLTEGVSLAGRCLVR